MNGSARSANDMSDPLSLLNRRYSIPSRQLGEPAPDEASLQALLQAAIRVPDHGKLEPFRLIRLQGEAKLRFGEALAAIAERNHPEMSDAKLAKERLRYTYAPLVVTVIARVNGDSKVPEIEQKLCAGSVACNLLLGATAMGFGAQWLTGWAAYDAEVACLLGLAANESVIGFVHLGTAQMEVPDRDRPLLADLFSTWSP